MESSPLFSLASSSSWLKPTRDFIPLAEKPPKQGSGTPAQKLLEKATGDEWYAKASALSMTDEANYQQLKDQILSRYQEELLEKLGTELYAFLGVETPVTALSNQPLCAESRVMFPDTLHALYFVSRYVKGFEEVGERFFKDYPAQRLIQPKGPFYITLPDKTQVPLRGLGAMLAAADFLFDDDCLGSSGGNAGYVIRTDEKTGQRYAQLIKIDAGRAFSFFNERGIKDHNPLARDMEVATHLPQLHFADLNENDQREFAQMARHILSIPAVEWENKCRPAFGQPEWLPSAQLPLFLQPLIARKKLFLAAFSGEIDGQLVKEIEQTNIELAKRVNQLDLLPLSSEALKEQLATQHAQTEQANRLHSQLAVLHSQHREPVDGGTCKTFQLPLPDSAFSGRGDLLAKLAKDLQTQQGGVISQSIHGLGGVGKTQLAVQYARKAMAQKGGSPYQVIIWLHAESYLEGQFQAMAEAWLGKSGLKPEEAVLAIYHFLQNKPALLVFDNAQSIEAIEAFLPPQHSRSPWHLLITSRNPAWGAIPTCSLGGFSLEEARGFITEQLGAPPEPLLVALHALLGGLPLAYRQAVAYIKETKCTLERFIEQFRLNQADLLSQALIPTDDHPKAIGTIVTLSLAQAALEAKETRAVLGLMAYLAPEEIPLSLLQAVLGIPSAILETALSALARVSLLQRDANLWTVTVHRLVQDVVRQPKQTSQTLRPQLRALVTYLAVQLEYDKKDMASIHKVSPLIPHALAAMERLGSLERTFEETEEWCILLSRIGGQQHGVGNARVAKEVNEHLLTLEETHYGKDHVDVARTLVNLANAIGALGDTKKEKELLERALGILEQHHGKNHVEVVITLGNLGNANRILGDAKTAKKLLERALGILELHHGKNHVEVARTLNNLANAIGDLGDTTGKKRLLERALMIKERHYGKDHVEVAIILGNLGEANRILGDAKTAKKLLERALGILEQHHGKNHVDVARTLNNLAAAIGALGDRTEQKRLLERALGIKEQHYGKDHIETANTLSNLAAAIGVLGDVKKMKELLERALGIKEQRYGKGHIETASILLNLACAYLELKDVAQAATYASKAHHLFSTHFGSFHPHTQAAAELLEELKPLLSMAPSSLPLPPESGLSQRQLEKELRNAANQNKLEGEDSELAAAIKLSLQEQSLYQVPKPLVNPLKQEEGTSDKYSQSQLAAQIGFHAHPSIPERYSIQSLTQQAESEEEELEKAIELSLQKS